MKQGIYDSANFSHHDLILFFRHQLRVKIRCDRKHLNHITFDKKCVYAASLVVRKGTTFESSFPPLPAQKNNGPDPSGPYPKLVEILVPLDPLVSILRCVIGHIT